MTGLDLETFLLLLRADLVLGGARPGRGRSGAAGLVVLGLAAGAAAIPGAVAGGPPRAGDLREHRPGRPEGRPRGTPDPTDREHIRRIRVAPLVESGRPTGRPATGGGPGRLRRSPRLELAASAPNLADPACGDRPPPAMPGTRTSPKPSPSAARDGHGDASPGAPGTEIHRVRPAARIRPRRRAAPPAPPTPAPPDMAELDRTPAVGLPGRQSRCARPIATAPERSKRAIGAPDLALRNDVRLRPGRSRYAVRRRRRPRRRRQRGPRDRNRATAATSAARTPASGTPGHPRRTPARSGTCPTRRADRSRWSTSRPRARPTTAGGPAWPRSASGRPCGRRPKSPRSTAPASEPDRPDRARLAGASAASELAVERALDWLARHQDARRPMGCRDRPLRRRHARQGRP